MPLWPRKPDPTEPTYRRYRDRINFAFNVTLFAFVDSIFWFLRLLYTATWPWVTWVTGILVAVIVLQGLYVFRIADYSGADDLPGTLKKSDLPGALEKSALSDEQG